jgi:hypothetical protein
MKAPQLRTNLRPTTERLEERTVPALFGNTWVDPTAIAISIMPDGTNIQGAPSNLIAQLSSTISLGTARAQLTSALGFWQQAANVNFHYRGDDGAAINAPGPVQGSNIRGDIRIGMRPLGNNVLAIATPFDMISSASGEIILNSNKTFSTDGAAGTYDLRTVLLQELGHALGMGNSSNSASVMFEQYQGKRFGLHETDVSALQQLYGTRRNDQFDKGNTATNAFQLGYIATAGEANSSRFNTNTLPLVIEPNMMTGDRKDTYRFVYEAPGATATGTPQVALRTTGMSMLLTKLSILDDAGEELAATVALNPESGDLSLNLSNLNLVPGETYLIRVTNLRRAPFDGGKYRIAVGMNAVEAVNATYFNYAETQTSNQAAGTSVFTAVNDLGKLAARSRPTWDLSGTACLNYAGDVDTYKLKTRDTTEPVMTVAVWVTQGNDTDFRVRVYNANQSLLASETLWENGIGSIYQVPGINHNQNYFVTVENMDGTAVDPVNYRIAINFRATPVTLTQLQNAVLNANNKRDYGTVQVHAAQGFYYELNNLAAAADQVVKFKFFDAAGNVLHTLEAGAGQTARLETLLLPGRYYYGVEAASLTGGEVNAAYRLRYLASTDPIGPTPIEPGGYPADEPSGSGGGGATYENWTADDWAYFWLYGEFPPGGPGTGGGSGGGGGGSGGGG